MDPGTVKLIELLLVVVVVFRFVAQQLGTLRRAQRRDDEDRTRDL